MHDENDPRSEEQTDAVTGDEVTPDEPGSQEPDEDAGPAVEPTQGDQGEPVEQNALPVGGTVAGFDPDRAVSTSPPPADAQSGVPALPENEGVEAQPQFAKGVDPAQGSVHAEESQTDSPRQDDEARAEHQPSAEAQGRKVG